MCDLTTRVYTTHTSLIILPCITVYPVISSWLLRIKESSSSWWFPTRPENSWRSPTLRLSRRNGGQRDPEASWSFPVFLQRCVCPWKERWRSLVKVCRAEQRLVTLNTSCPLAYTMTSSWHQPAFLLMVHYCFSSQTYTQHLNTRNKTFFHIRAHTHTQTHSLLKTFITTQKHTQAIRR